MYPLSGSYSRKPKDLSLGSSRTFAACHAFVSVWKIYCRISHSVCLLNDVVGVCSFGVRFFFPDLFVPICHMMLSIGDQSIEK